MSKQFTAEEFKDEILKLEKENLEKINKDNNKIMVNKIIRKYEESKQDDNK